MVGEGGREVNMSFKHPISTRKKKKKKKKNKYD
ncbi:MAG: hypothetical protein MRERV_34c011 [Mycoplasmataceae bacterium RV_VA103A]|nr:MAG: hypothetical protein MRERV_34c011 [Mycoplasmataceae bacterium RV_VA103A]